jgi:hypothetical protein
MALVTIIDGNGFPQQVTWQAQDQINDFSGVLGAPAIGPTFTPQQVAPANLLRAGFLYQNTSQVAMIIFEDGDTEAGFIVAPSEYFPPFQNYPIPTGAMFVVGTANSEIGDSFTFREWVNAPT